MSPCSSFCSRLNTRIAGKGSRSRCPGTHEIEQPAELGADQFAFELAAQSGMFPFLDHPGAQQQGLHLVGKAPGLLREVFVSWLSRRDRSMAYATAWITRVSMVR